MPRGSYESVFITAMDESLADLGGHLGAFGTIAGGSRLYMDRIHTLLKPVSSWRLSVPTTLLRKAIESLRVRRGPSLDYWHGWLFQPRIVEVGGFVVAIVTPLRRPPLCMVVFIDRATERPYLPADDDSDYATVSERLGVRQPLDHAYLYRYACGCFGEFWRSSRPVPLLMPSDCNTVGIARESINWTWDEGRSYWWQRFGGVVFSISSHLPPAPYEEHARDAGDYTPEPVYC